MAAALHLALDQRAAPAARPSNHMRYHLPPSPLATNLLNAPTPDPPHFHHNTMHSASYYPQHSPSPLSLDAAQDRPVPPHHHSRFAPHPAEQAPLPPAHFLHQHPIHQPAHPLDPYAEPLLLPSDSPYCAVAPTNPNGAPAVTPAISPGVAPGIIAEPRPHPVPRDSQPHTQPFYDGNPVPPLPQQHPPALVEMGVQNVLPAPSAFHVEQHQSQMQQEDKIAVPKPAHRELFPPGPPSRNLVTRVSPLQRRQTVSQHVPLPPVPAVSPPTQQSQHTHVPKPHLQHHAQHQSAQPFNYGIQEGVALVSVDNTASPPNPYLSVSLSPSPLMPPDAQGVLQQQPIAHVSNSQHSFGGNNVSQPVQQGVFSVPDLNNPAPCAFGQQQPTNNGLCSRVGAEDPGATPLQYVAVPQQQPSQLFLSPMQNPVDQAFPQALAPSPDMGIHPLAQPAASSSNVMGVADLLTGSQYSVPPDMMESFMSVGRACRELGRYDLATSVFRACATIWPDSVEARNSYTASCYSQGYYDPSLDAGGGFPEDVFNDVGNTLRNTGRTADAELAYKACLAIAPRHAHAWNNLGNAMRARGAIMDAMSCYTASLSAQPGFAAAHCNLAGLFRDQGKPQDAETQYRAALISDPNLAEAAAGLGTALRDMGRTEEAVSFYVRAVNLKPDAPDHHANLANTYKDLNRIEESITSYQAALSIQPDLPDAFCNMVHSLCVICDWRNREQNFATLLAIIDRQLDTLLHHPATNPRLYNTIVGALSNSTPQLVDANGGSRSERDGLSVSASVKEENSVRPRRRFVHHPSSPTVVRKARLKGKFAGFVTSSPSVVQPVVTSGLPSVQPFHALIYPMRPEKFRALSAAYASRAESMVQGIPNVTQRWTFPKGPRARLKVGYVSSDYNNHPYSHLTQSIYGLHRTGISVECFCYALTPSDQSSWRLRIEREAEHFRDISSLTAKQSAETIANDGIHVLINCNGYTKGARTELFALRPAPVQVSFMGFPGTLGAHYIEYFITDVVTSPPEMASRMHSEALLYHPHSYFVNDHRQTSTPGPRAYPAGPLTRAHYGLPENCFLFIMHNQLYKLSPDTFDVWARILKRVPGSKLWLLRFPPTGEQRILNEAAARGLSSDRLIFTDVAGKDEHVARAGLGDLFLDTPTCNAHTTGTDALWSGIPMITCPGSLFASRVAASLLTAAGVPELIASDMVEYEELAVELAHNRSKLAEIRAKIESSRFTNALFDTERWVRNVEDLYWKAWKNFEAGKEPTHIFGKDIYDGSTMVSKPSAVESIYSTTDSRRSETRSLMYGNMYNSAVVT